MKLTRHQDYSLSLRLRLHGDGTETPSADDLLHCLEAGALGMQQMAMKCEQGLGLMGDRPQDAAGYLALAERYQRMADAVRAAQK